MQNQPSQRSLLLPLLLIAGGVIWLLTQANIISGANIAMLFSLIPLILIILGVELVLRGRYPRAAMLFGIGSIVVLVVLVLFGPAFGLVNNREVQSAHYEEAIDGANSAEVNIGLAVGTITVDTLQDSENLFEADITYVGRVEFFERGDDDRFISLQQTESDNGNFDFGDLFNYWDVEGEEINWNVLIAPDMLLNLEVNAGVGRSVLNLADLNLTELNVNAGVGDVSATLPSADFTYEATFSGGTGNLEVAVSQGAAVELFVSGGVGATTIDLPDDASVTLIARTGLGGVTVPDDYTRDDGENNSGTWHSAGYTDDARQITVHYEGGVGSLTIR